LKQLAADLVLSQSAAWHSATGLVSLSAPC
jgi:hypothetical protein